jgi:hypothetical protein
VATVSPQTLTFTACNQDRNVTVTAGARGTATISVAQASGAGSNTTGSGTYDYAPASFTVTVNNIAPTLSDIADQSTNEDTSTGPIAFTVGDAGTPAGNLTVTGSSSNTTLVPNSNISFGGSGANRTLTVTPAAGQTGTATITLVHPLDLEVIAEGMEAEEAVADLRALGCNFGQGDYWWTPQPAEETAALLEATAVRGWQL